MVLEGQRLELRTERKVWGCNSQWMEQIHIFWGVISKVAEKTGKTVNVGFHGRKLPSAPTGEALIDVPIYCEQTGMGILKISANAVFSLQSIYFFLQSF